MDQYYIVFRIDLHTEKGKELSRLIDSTSTIQKFVKGFLTKRLMNEFFEEYESGMFNPVRLKPVS